MKIKSYCLYFLFFITSFSDGMEKQAKQIGTTLPLYFVFTLEVPSKSYVMRVDALTQSYIQWNWDHKNNTEREGCFKLGTHCYKQDDVEFNRLEELMKTANTQQLTNKEMFAHLSMITQLMTAISQ